MESGETVGKELRLKRFRALARVRALHEVVVVNLEQLHGAVLTGLGNEAAPVGMLLAFGEMMDSREFLFSPKCGDQRSQMAVGALTDMFIECEHDHAYMLIYNHLLRRGVEDGNVHWGCYPDGIWAFANSDMWRQGSFIAGGAWRARKTIENAVGLFLFGEGAVSQGAAHEVNTFLSAFNSRRSEEALARYNGPISERAKSTRVMRPTPFLGGMQINDWSIYTNPFDEHGGRHIRDNRGKSLFAHWVEGYGMRGFDVDGNDLEAVINITKKALRLAQRPVPIPSYVMLHMAGRLTGHNEHQVTRTPEARRARDWGRASILQPGDSSYISEEQMQALWANEPLKRYREFLVQAGIASEDELKKIYSDECATMDERWARALKEPPASFEDAIKKRERKHFMFAPHEWGLPQMERPLDRMHSGGTTTTRAFLDTAKELLAENEMSVYLGEDVGSGGVLIATRELQKKFGAERVFDTPIAEEGITGFAVGYSIEDWILRERGEAEQLCIVLTEKQFMPFDGDGEVVARNIGPNYYQKQMPHRFIEFLPYGVVHGGGSGKEHSDETTAHYMSILGVALVCASDAFDLVGLMRAAAETQWPVFFMIPIWSFGEQECAAEIPKERYVIPLGKAAVKRTGKHISVLTYGMGVRAMLNEAEFLAEDGIDVEVVDLRTLQPLDMETIAASIKKTGRVVVMCEGAPSVAEMIIGQIVSNTEMCDALARTPKPLQKEGESMEDWQKRVKEWIKETRANVFDKHLDGDLDSENLAPRIVRLSRDKSPIANPPDIEWNDLPFEQYFVMEPDEFGEPKRKKKVRSMRFAAIAHDLMRYQ